MEACVDYGTDRKCFMRIDSVASFTTVVDEEEAALRFAARGFAEALTHVPGQPRTTKRTYSYAFPEEDGPALVQLIERAPPSG